MWKNKTNQSSTKAKYKIGVLLFSSSFKHTVQVLQQKSHQLKQLDKFFSFHLHGLTAFNNDMTGLVDERKAVDIIYLDFSKAFETVSQHCHRQTDEVWIKWMDTEVDWKLADYLGPEDCEKWFEV